MERTLETRTEEEPIRLEDYKRVYRWIVRREERRGFLLHVLAYLVGNGILIAVNLSYAPQVLWFLYPLLGWGILLALHHQVAVRWLDYTLDRREALAEELLRRGVQVPPPPGRPRA